MVEHVKPMFSEQISAFVAGCCIVGCLATWIAMAEILQDVQQQYPKPMFIGESMQLLQRHTMYTSPILFSPPLIVDN